MSWSSSTGLAACAVWLSCHAAAAAVGSCGCNHSCTLTLLLLLGALGHSRAAAQWEVARHAVPFSSGVGRRSDCSTAVLLLLCCNCLALLLLPGIPPKLAFSVGMQQQSLRLASVLHGGHVTGVVVGAPDVYGGETHIGYVYCLKQLRQVCNCDWDALTAAAAAAAADENAAADAAVVAAAAAAAHCDICGAAAVGATAVAGTAWQWWRAVSACGATATASAAAVSVACAAGAASQRLNTAAAAAAVALSVAVAVDSMCRGAAIVVAAAAAAAAVAASSAARRAARSVG